VRYFNLNGKALATKKAVRAGRKREGYAFKRRMDETLVLRSTATARH
jgi:hypothetical protein